MATPTAIKYRINWRSKIGATGHGKPVFSDREVAQHVADQVNLHDQDKLLHHWVEEAVPNEQTITDN